MNDIKKSPAVDETAGRRTKLDLTGFVSAFKHTINPDSSLFPQSNFTQNYIKYYKTYYGMLFGGNYD